MKDAKGHGSEKRGTHSVGVNDIGRVPDINHPVYNTAERPRGYNSQVSPLSADYVTGGRMLRGRMGDMTKDQHVAAGEHHFANASAVSTAYGKAIDTAMFRLGGRDPGPLISGIVSDKFGEHDKTLLRDLATKKSQHTSAGFAHYAAAGKRLDTARGRFQFHKKGS